MTYIDVFFIAFKTCCVKTRTIAAYQTAICLLLALPELYPNENLLGRVRMRSWLGNGIG